MGAWDFGVIKAPITVDQAEGRLGIALVTFKRELVYNGFAEHEMNVEKPNFGKAASDNVKKFQTDRGLPATGVINIATSRELFRKRITEAEQKFDLPRGTLGKKIALESAFDPVAVGTADPDDTGIAQINLRIHSSVSKDQAFNPQFALNWAGAYIRSNYDRVASDANVMKAARASYNIGVHYATQWMLAGFPNSGGPLLGGQDSFTRATQYISLIDKQTW